MKLLTNEGIGLVHLLGGQKIGQGLYTLQQTVSALRKPMVTGELLACSTLDHVALSGDGVMRWTELEQPSATSINHAEMTDTDWWVVSFISQMAD